MLAGQSGVVGRAMTRKFQSEMELGWRIAISWTAISGAKESTLHLRHNWTEEDHRRHLQGQET